MGDAPPAHGKRATAAPVPRHDPDEWFPAVVATVGVVCHIKCRDGFGEYALPGLWFMHEDREWYRVTPPIRCEARVSRFRIA